MMLLDKYVTINLAWSNYKYYRDLGYEFTDEYIKNSNPISVKQSDVLHNSQDAYLEYICDFCGKTHKKTPYNYYKGRSVVEIDNCANQSCVNAKKNLKNEKLYGTTKYNEIAKIKGITIGRSKKYTKSDLYEMAEKKNYSILSSHDENIIVKDRIVLKCNIHNVQFETSIENFMNDKKNNCP